MSDNKIGSFIQLSRKEKGLTQKDLAEQIGVSDKTISKWENGNSVPDTAILNSLCEALDISVNELLSGEKLPVENYSMKAEENMMNLLKQNEDNLIVYCNKDFNLKQGKAKSPISGLGGVSISCEISSLLSTSMFWDSKLTI